ncbi:phosphotransferase [Phlyctema vagabunda]|uniref:Phosphotransferase n=1 Tax=Phlyctema vagabunda TaxID=108571 RepID=A0ABR4PG80_9HELO
MSSESNPINKSNTIPTLSLSPYPLLQVLTLSAFLCFTIFEQQYERFVLERFSKTSMYYDLAMDDDMQDYDNVAWDRDDEIYEKAVLNLRKTTTCERMETLTSKKCEQQATMNGPLKVGGYNAIYQMNFQESSVDDVIIRVPIFGSIKFPEEKTIAEVATMTFLREKTNISVPAVLHYGISHQNPNTGPYIIMSYIPNNGSLSKALNDPLVKEGDPHILNRFISSEKLLNLYTQMARHLTELSQHHFPRIGSLLLDPETRSYTVATRPLSVNMNQAVRLSNIPASILPPREKTYTTVDEWYVELTRMHFAQLVFQQNDLVENADDCRNKYLARLLFWKLARAGKLSTFGFGDDDWSVQSKSHDSSTKLLPAPPQTGTFNLWCDDLRAGNVLLDGNDCIVSLIDFEFTYVAPRQFALDPPWWLLLEQPERWDDGIESWTRVYNERVQVWFTGMEAAEKELGRKENLTTYMRESWETGRFWLNYAARKSWAFDSIYWKYLDEKVFGLRAETGNACDRWRRRVNMLSPEETVAMERFVKRKMEDGVERILVDWEPEEASERLQEVLDGCQDVGGMMEALNLM